MKSSVEQLKKTLIDTIEEQLPVPASFPAIKAEPEQVSYMSVCTLLDTFQQYPLMLGVFHHLQLYTCQIKQFCCSEWKFLPVLGLCESPVTESVCK
jgi:hypothetical protein